MTTEQPIPPAVVLSTALLAAACPECGSTDTEWHCSQQTNSGVVDGRLRMHDVHTVFFLGCNECSETIRTIGGDKLARLLTEAANAGVSVEVPTKL